jgi:hypothetical protein
MYRREHRHQLSFEDFFLPFGCKLPGDNRWIKLAELIPWDELEDDYAAQFCKVFRAPAKPFRMALGALTIKARLGLTDEELVEPTGSCTGRFPGFAPHHPAHRPIDWCSTHSTLPAVQCYPSRNA